MDLVTLVCPPGSSDYPISHGLVDYRKDAYRADHLNPDADWLVPVPRDVALHFLHRGGFKLAKINIDHPSGETVRLVDKDGVLGRSLGFDGVSYEADADGVLVVPAAAAAIADSHNLEPARPEDPRLQTDAQKAAAEADRKHDEHKAGEHGLHASVKHDADAENKPEHDHSTLGATDEVVIIKAHEPVEIVKEDADAAAKSKAATRRIASDEALRREATPKV